MRWCCGPASGKIVPHWISGERLCVVSTDPVTAAQKDLGRLAVHVSCNDAASSGAEPVAMLLTLLAPPKSSVADIEVIMLQAFETAQALNVEIIGGHTEITDGVTRPILSGMVLASCKSDGLIKTSGGQMGDALLLTKTAGLEGTYIMASDFTNRALAVLGQKDLAVCLALKDQISVVPEGLLAARNGVHAMHDVTEGGVLGAVHELCTASGCGVLVEENDIAVLPRPKRCVQPFVSIRCGSSPRAACSSPALTARRCRPYSTGVASKPRVLDG